MANTKPNLSTILKKDIERDSFYTIGEYLDSSTPTPTLELLCAPQQLNRVGVHIAGAEGRSVPEAMNFHSNKVTIQHKLAPEQGELKKVETLEEWLDRVSPTLECINTVFPNRKQLFMISHIMIALTMYADYKNHENPIAEGRSSSFVVKDRFNITLDRILIFSTKEDELSVRAVAMSYCNGNESTSFSKGWESDQKFLVAIAYSILTSIHGKHIPSKLKTYVKDIRKKKVADIEAMKFIDELATVENASLGKYLKDAGATVFFIVIFNLIGFLVSVAVGYCIRMGFEEVTRKEPRAILNGGKDFRFSEFTYVDCGMKDQKPDDGHLTLGD